MNNDDYRMQLIALRHRISKAIAQIHSIKVLEGIAQRAETDLSIIQGKVAQRRRSRARNTVEISAADTIWE